LPCVCFFLLRPPPRSALFPYTTLFRSIAAPQAGKTNLTSGPCAGNAATALLGNVAQGTAPALGGRFSKQKRGARGGIDLVSMMQDRKSTRLNSSHVKISYAVFCLKKKN